MYLQRTFIYKWIIGTVSLSQWLLLGLQGQLFILFIDQIPSAFTFAQLYCAGHGEGCFDLEYIDICNTNSVVLITNFMYSVHKSQIDIKALINPSYVVFFFGFFFFIYLMICIFLLAFISHHVLFCVSNCNLNLNEFGSC